MTARAERRMLPIVAFASMIMPATSLAAEDAGPSPAPFYATASCQPAAKPGRVRCRAALELPLSDAASAEIDWAELRVLSTSAGLSALRGRLGVLDAESRDGARVVWSFSLAAAHGGDLSARVRLSATIRKKSGQSRTDSRELEVAVRVEP